MIIIKGYYDMTTTDENMNWMTLTHLLSNFFSPLNLTTPFVHLPLLHISKQPYWMYALEKNIISPLCVLYRLIPQIIPLLAPMLVHTWYEESTPRILSKF